MSEYWKSNPRKFCDFCKCWIADNKPSVEFHERGKRHKENVDKRIAEMSRKGQEDWENKQAEGEFFKQMEANALKAYKSDIEKNPDMTGNKISEIASANNAELFIKGDESKSEDKESPLPKVIKKWYEAKSPEDTSYYWNTDTGESSWDIPSEGFLSVDEQKKIEEAKNKRKEKKAKKLEEKASSISAAPMMHGPAPRVQVYNAWETVNKEPEPQIDLGLPELPEEEYYYVPEINTKSEVSFKEKTVTLSGFSKGTSTGFKKRKGNEDHKKNVRSRNNDL